MAGATMGYLGRTTASRDATGEAARTTQTRHNCTSQINQQSAINNQQCQDPLMPITSVNPSAGKAIRTYDEMTPEAVGATASERTRRGCRGARHVRRAQLADEESR